MRSEQPHDNLTRREMLRLSAAGMAALQAPALFRPAVTHAAPRSSPATAESQLYSTLLKTWCDGLIARQIVAMRDPVFYGGLLCPACALIHGRCGDAVYPLLKMAHSTGDQKYVRAAKLVYQCSQAQVSRPDGSWINDITLNRWRGITFFHSIALGAGVVFEARGRLMSNAHKPIEGDGLTYKGCWTIDDAGVDLRASVTGPVPGSASLEFIVPVIVRPSDAVEQASPQSVRISKPNGLLMVTVDSDHDVEPIPDVRTFNLVPGFEAVPLIVRIQPGNEVAMRIQAGGDPIAGSNA
jgi:hypothetical protein